MQRLGSPDTDARGNEEGFTLIELTVAMSLLAIVMVGFAGAVFGSMGAWAASRQRSAFVEIANAEMETVRALPYAAVGVNKTTDTNWSSAYPSGKRQSRDLVEVTSAQAPRSVSTVTTSPVKGITLPYTVRRWVTWTDVSGGNSHVFKRIEIEVQWTENNRIARSLTLTSIRYPGGLGAGTGNTVPVSSFTASSLAVNAQEVVTFNGSASSDPDGDAITYSWNFGDGTTISGAASTVHAFAAGGTYTVVLTVADGAGGTGTSSRTITVGSAGNDAPDASFSSTPSSGTAPLSVNVDATGSSDLDGDTLTYSWNWGDGTVNGSGVNATHSFASAGDFTITLTVTDPSGATDTATSTVHVDPLNCDVLTGSFNNPGSNGTANFIDVSSNNKPISNTFVFTATSNTACTSITARIPDASGMWAVPLTKTGTSGSVATWEGTGDFANRDRFNTGNAQTGEFWSPGSTGTADKLSFSFNVS